jgi:hypothetical protein
MAGQFTADAVHRARELGMRLLEKPFPVQALGIALEASMGKRRL